MYGVIVLRVGVSMKVVIERASLPFKFYPPGPNLRGEGALKITILTKNWSYCLHCWLKGLFEPVFCHFPKVG